jgi:hypothetical protein
MRTFMRHAAKPIGDQPTLARHEPDASEDYLKTSERVIDVECDEVALDRG